MNHEKDWNEQQAARAKRQSESFEAAEVARAYSRHDGDGGQRDAELLGDPEVVERQRDADEFGDDGEGVQQEQVDDAEGSPEPPEALEDESRMADAGHRAKAKDHLLIDVKDRNQQQQRPQERRAVVLPRLSIRAKGAGVIVPDHDDEARAEYRQQRLEAMFPTDAGSVIAVKDGAQGAMDVAHMGFVESRALRAVFQIYVQCQFSSLSLAGDEPQGRTRPLRRSISLGCDCCLKGVGICAHWRAEGHAGGPTWAVVHGGVPLRCYGNFRGRVAAGIARGGPTRFVRGLHPRANQPARDRVDRPGADERASAGDGNAIRIRGDGNSNDVPGRAARPKMVGDLKNIRELVHRSSPMPLIRGPEHERQAGALGPRNASHTVSATVDGFYFARRRLRGQNRGRGAKAAIAHVSFCGC